MILLILFILGAALGSLTTGLLGRLISNDFVLTYGTIISYPMMFIPPMLYASANSRRNDMFETGSALDSNNFGKMGGRWLTCILAVATLATAVVSDSLAKVLPETPEWFENAMEAIMDAPVWITLLSVSVFAPLFEEWLCRGLVLRGLLQKMNPTAALSVSAIFFAVLHMNPWQAVPAFILGSLFGYVYYKTGSLKLTMMMHCVNNTFAVIFSKIPATSEAESLMDVISPWAYACIFVACLAFIWGTIVTLRSIPMNSEQARCNCNEVDSLSI